MENALDDAFDALGNRHRRRLVLALLERTPQSDGVEVGEDESGDAVRRATVMYHTHLPKLEAGGYVDWDEEAHEVTRGAQFEELRPILELLDAHADDLPDD